MNVTLCKFYSQIILHSRETPIKGVYGQWSHYAKPYIIGNLTETHSKCCVTKSKLIPTGFPVKNLTKTKKKDPHPFECQYVLLAFFHVAFPVLSSQRLKREKKSLRQGSYPFNPLKHSVPGANTHTQYSQLLKRIPEILYDFF